MLEYDRNTMTLHRTRHGCAFLYLITGYYFKRSGLLMAALKARIWLFNAMRAFIPLKEYKQPFLTGQIMECATNDEYEMMIRKRAQNAYI